MQLRHYLGILRRYWPMVAALPLLVGALSLAAALREPLRYSTVARLMVTQALPDSPPSPPPAYLRDQWDGSEFLIDDLPQVIGSALFAQDVSAALRERGVALDAGAVQSGLSAETFHRSVTLRATADTPAAALALAEAAIETVRANGLTYWGRRDPAGSGGINVAVLDAPAAALPGRTPRRLAVDVGLRAGLGLAAGIGLAFLLHYLDTRLRGPGDVEEWVGLPVVGVIPRE
jgi:capsular polysaccharide biosynthesis protein